MNGKLRDRVEASSDASEEELLELARASEKVQGHIDGKQVVKEVVVPGKLVNLVVVRVSDRRLEPSHGFSVGLLESAACWSGGSRRLPSRSGTSSAPTFSWTPVSLAHGTCP